jgi:hypothetical protein
MEKFSTTAPGKLGERAVKEDMSCIFRDMTEGTGFYSHRLVFHPLST